LLILGFLVFGTAVYWATGPANAPGRGVSLSDIARDIRQEFSDADVTIPIARTAETSPGDATIFSIDNFSGRVIVIGESRDDIAAELKGVAFGIDQKDAEAIKGQIAPAFKLDGETVHLTVTRPERFKRRPRLDLIVRVPTEIALHLDAARGDADIQHVRELHVLRSARLKVLASNIREALVVTLENGELEAQDIGTVTLDLRDTQARIEHSSGGLKGSCHDGSLRLQAISGAIELKQEGGSMEIDGSEGPVTLKSERGEIRIDRPQGPVTVDSEHSTLDLRLNDPVTTTVTSANGGMTITLPRTGSFALDAEAVDGGIRAAPDAPVKQAGNVWTLMVGEGHPLVRLRNKNGTITVR